jgi:hypothetical protein
VVLERRAPVPNAQVQVQVPEDPDERSAWLAAGARRLGQTVRDTLVHRVDAELAVGREVTVDPTLAGDGQTLHFCATDGGLGAAGEWLVRRGASGLAWERGHGPADVTVRGRAADLLVVLTRRADPASRVEVAGDEPLFAHWLDHSRF